MRKRVSNNFSLRAVSAVVGVMLMVMLTVILATIVGTFVLNLGGEVEKSPRASITVYQESETRVTVKLSGLQVADRVYVTSSEPVTYMGGINGTLSYDTGPSNPDQYLYGETSGGEVRGGVGTTVTVLIQPDSVGELSVIGVVDGKAEVIQTYSFGE